MKATLPPLVGEPIGEHGMKLTVLLSTLGVLSMFPAVAQSPAWAQLANSGPAPRAVHAMAHDSLRGRTVVFGGAGQTTAFADTWEWDGLTWSQAASVGPAYRRGHAMAFDSQRGRVVLFGGQGGTVFGDTWEWDGATWTLVANSGPSPRDLVAMAYDSARGRTVLYGGLAGAFCLADTWEWNGFAWTQAVAGGPPGRVRHAMAYDMRRAKTVLFGGDQLAVFTELGDTWEWNGVGWVLASGSGPAARTTHAMAYDTVRHRCVLFGGESGSGPSFMQHGDTWEWDGLAWVQTLVTGPSARNHASMAFDVQRGRTVLFGGQVVSGSTSTVVGDTWTWGGGAPPSPSATASAFGGGCGAPPMSLSPDPTGLPVVGATARALVSNVPSPFAVVALGWSNVSIGALLLPAPLDGYGMLGCSVLQSTDVVGLPVTFTGGSTATYSLPIPLWPSLLSVHVYLQGLAVAPGVNPAGVIISNGLDLHIGY